MIRSILITAAVSALSGAGLAWRFAPRTIETKTEYVDRWKTVTVTKYITKTKTRTITKPDGTVIKEHTETQSNTGSNTVAKSTVLPKWSAGALVGFTPGAANSTFAGVSLSRHLVGPVWVGGFATVPVNKPLTVPTVGVSLGVTW